MSKRKKTPVERLEDWIGEQETFKRAAEVLGISTQALHIIRTKKGKPGRDTSAAIKREVGIDVEEWADDAA